MPVLTDKLTSWQIAGARLTGVRHGLANGNDIRVMTTPDGVRHSFGIGKAGYPGNREAVGRDRVTPDLPHINRSAIYPTFGDFLDDWQPDTVTSASRQFYIDTGTYFPMGSRARAMVDAPPWEHAGEDGDDLPPAPEIDALDQIRGAIEAYRGAGDARSGDALSASIDAHLCEVGR